MEQVGSYVTLNPDELDAYLAKFERQPLEALTIVGPRLDSARYMFLVHQSDARRLVIRLTGPVNNLAERLTKVSVVSALGLLAVDLDGSEISTLARAHPAVVTLDIRFNRLGIDGAIAIGRHLPRLRSLALDGSRIDDRGAIAIANNLKQLEKLTLGGSRITTSGATAIANNLEHLTHLDLRGNQIDDDGATAIGNSLLRLTSLNLNFNQIGSDGATAIANGLNQLTSLDLGNNRITSHGAIAIAKGLGQLTSLDLSNNKITDSGAAAIAKGLTRLTSLNLNRTRIGNDGARSLLQHPRLTHLELRGNSKLRALPANVPMHSLRRLDLASTGIADASPLADLVEGGLQLQWGPLAFEGIEVTGCPLVHPPPEVVKQGQEAVLNYFREIKLQGVDHLCEAKVLVVGEGRAGKTSLITRLYCPGEPLPAEDKSTRGIDVRVREFPLANGKTFRLNVWDFGGQQIYHATHQFFLTKNSLYVLVDDTGKDHKSVRDEGFKYWLEAVEAFGAKSPLIIFQNEKGGRSKSIDEAGIKDRFRNVQETVRGDLARADAAEGLRRSIERIVQQLPHIGEEVPAKWVEIRSDVEVLSRTTPYLSINEYFDLYARHLEPDREKALHLSRYLHDLGVFLHFQDDLCLRGIVIIQNRWATEAVFRALDDEQIKSQLGRFTLADCDRIWARSVYRDMHRELLALMEKFELCYRLIDARPDTWLVPQLLPPSLPGDLHDWDSPDDLVLRYRYEFLPRGLVNRLMVRMHRFVARPDLCWNGGVLFEHKQTQLLVRADDGGDAITLRSHGPERKELLSVIANAVDALNDSFEGLRDKVQKLVPCVCERCRSYVTPELFEQDHLIERKNAGKLTIECRKSYADVSVIELLDGWRLHAPPSWAADATPPRKPAAITETHRRAKLDCVRGSPRVIKIFLASSEELRDDRDEFDLHFRQRNDHCRKNGMYLQIVRWETFLDAMSETRLQDEYNREVRNADLFVSLFRTRTGKYTEEEFDIAHAAFKEHGRPLIFTFFREAHVPNNEEGLAALSTLVAFKNKLTGLGHFYTRYNSAEHLNLLFRERLEKLESTDWFARAGG